MSKSSGAFGRRVEERLRSVRLHERRIGQPRPPLEASADRGYARQDQRIRTGSSRLSDWSTASERQNRATCAELQDIARAAVADRPDARGSGAACRNRRARRRRGRIRVPRRRAARPSTSSRPGRARCSTTIAVPSTTPSGCWCTSATTRRGTRRSPPTTTPFATGGVVGIHNGIIVERRRALRPPRHRAARAGDDGRLRGDLRARRRSTARATDVLEQLVGAMAAAWIDEREPTSSTSRAASAARSGSGGDATRCSSPRRAPALEVVERALGTTLPQDARSTRAGCCRSWTASSSQERRWSPDRSYREDRQLPAVRAPHEGRSCLDRLCGDRRAR